MPAVNSMRAPTIRRKRMIGNNQYFFRTRRNPNKSAKNSIIQPFPAIHLVRRLKIRASRSSITLDKDTALASPLFIAHCVGTHHPANQPDGCHEQGKQNRQKDTGTNGSEDSCQPPTKNRPGPEQTGRQHCQHHVHNRRQNKTRLHVDISNQQKDERQSQSSIPALCGGQTRWRILHGYILYIYVDALVEVRTSSESLGWNCSVKIPSAVATMRWVLARSLMPSLIMHSVETRS